MGDSPAASALAHADPRPWNLAARSLVFALSPEQDRIPA